MIKLTDELLAAYLDGELNAQEVASVDEALARDSEARARLQAFRQLSVLLQTSGAAQARRPGGVQGTARPNQRWRFARTGLASACVAGLLWAGSGMLDREVDLSRRRLLHEVVEQFTREGSSSLPRMAVQSASLESASGWLSRQLGRTVDVPLLPGWTFTSGQILKYGPPPLVELVYSAPGRQPIAICITRSERADHPPTATIIHGLRVAAWDQDGHFLALLGQLSSEELDQLSSHVQKDLAIRHARRIGAVLGTQAGRRGTGSANLGSSADIIVDDAIRTHRPAWATIRTIHPHGGATAGTMPRAV